ncbi:LAMI_0G11474g1_1 [Lachancea mirantina]|uniref:LAMI_0G11474g1_1 n=1 Tax=Lachancea mirantina TaxID=1230905 RepID=A0A1G4KB53_9SACH|nr:LAMI_0G11474g1_1 [Lachancea mirantina]
MDLEKVLGYGYAIPWCLSIYPSLFKNWRQKSASAISVDFLIINIVGYVCLTSAIFLQLFCWQETNDENEPLRPTVTQFDLWYCVHSLVMNGVLASQLLYGKRLWSFQTAGVVRMKILYKRILRATLAIIAISLIPFCVRLFNENLSNTNTLALCNRLIALKILMSLIKYFPQVKHNYERKKMRDFPMLCVVLDVFGSICSIAQLIVKLKQVGEPSIAAAATSNFGKIGIACVTLLFNFIYVSQWLVYRGHE